MKKTVSRIFALLLAAVLIVSLTACGSFGSIIGADEAKFARGTVSGNTYTSDFIGLTFRAPDGWTFYTDEEIKSLLNVTASYLDDSSAFEEATDAEIIDFFCNSDDGASNVDLSFSKSSSFVSLDASVKASVEFIEQQYEQMGLTCSASDPVERTLCGRDYKMVELNVNDMMTQYFYMTVIGKYVVGITGTFGDDTTAAEFEAMFS